jgi:hypothetical protein
MAEHTTGVLNEQDITPPSSLDEIRARHCARLSLRDFMRSVECDGQSGRWGSVLVVDVRPVEE